MFTGLIVGMGSVVSVTRGATSAVLAVDVPEAVSTSASLGDSIAVSGVCLTVTAIKGNRLSFDVSSETLASSALGSLKSGSSVNIEPSLTPSSKLGGHFVTGHVDAVGRIVKKRFDGQAWHLEIEAPADVTKFLVDKGSVTVDGISLTVVKVTRSGFTLVIIPHTADITTIGQKGVGSLVNLEADIIGKYVHRYLHGQKGEDSLLNTLRSEGFTAG